MTIQFNTLPIPHVRIIRKYDRPNVNIPWWTTIIPDYITEYYNTAYKSQNKLSEEWAESEDSLSLYHNSLYHSVDPAENQIWSTDPIVQSWFVMRQEYCDSVGITVHPSEVFIVAEGVETLLEMS
jgi:hypothetical protein